MMKIIFLKKYKKIQKPQTPIKAVTQEKWPKIVQGSSDFFNYSLLACFNQYVILGNRTNVILGGGRLAFQSNPDNSSSILDKWTCQRKDGRDLIGDWKNEKDEMSPGRSVVALNRQELMNVDASKTEFLFGNYFHSLALI